MRHTTRSPYPVILAALAALSTLGSGCSSEQFTTVNTSYKDSRTHSRESNASSLALAALASQNAIFQVTAALSERFAHEKQGPALAVPTGDLKVSSQIDAEKGTGALQGKRGDRPVLDLHFSFRPEPLDAGQKYVVSNLSGTMEGFQLLLPSLVLAYSKAYDDQGKARKDAAGQPVYQVSVDAHGLLGVDDQVVMRLPSALLTLTYPLPEQEAPIGTITADQNGLVFNGELRLSRQSFSASGAISAPDGSRLFDLSRDGAGVKLTPSRAAAPAASQAPPAGT